MIKNHLLEFANEVLNLPEAREIEMEWSGIMGMTPDKEPIIKPVDENVWLVAGLSGMGIAIGMDVAKKLLRNFSASVICRLKILGRSQSIRR